MVNICSLFVLSFYLPSNRNIFLMGMFSYVNVKGKRYESRYLLFLDAWTNHRSGSCSSLDGYLFVRYDRNVVMWYQALMLTLFLCLPFLLRQLVVEKGTTSKRSSNSGAGRFAAFLLLVVAGFFFWPLWILAFFVFMSIAV